MDLSLSTRSRLEGLYIQYLCHREESPSSLGRLYQNIFLATIQTRRVGSACRNRGPTIFTWTGYKPLNNPSIT